MALRSILIKPEQHIIPSNRIEGAICKERFWFKSKYLAHMPTHRCFLLFCNICNKGFYDQKILDEHYLTHTEVINTYDCNKCSKKFLQKYQLEQHMQLHNVVTNELVVKKKKSVHFSNTLESRTIDDFTDNEYFSDDEDFSEDFNNPINKISTTRSGRVVKHKKKFDHEPEVKRKYRKLKESYTKTSASSGKSNHPVELAVTQNCDAQPVKFVYKELRVVSEKIPDVLYQKYVANGNVCTYKTQNSSKSDCTSVQSNSQKIFSSDTGGNHDKKIAQPSQVLQSFGNSELSKKSELKDKPIVKPDVDTSNKPLISQKSERINQIINNDSNITINLDGKSKKDRQSSDIVTQKHVVELSPSGRSAKLSPAASITPSVELSSADRNVISTLKLPHFGKEFLYVGPKSDLNKIKEVIAEVQAMSKDDNFSIETNNFSPNKDGNTERVNISNVKDSKLTTKASTLVANKVSPVSVDTLPVICQSNNADIKKHQNHSSVSGKSMLNTDKMENLPSDSEEDGILDKKMVNNILVIKVTPDYMQKMQKKTLKSPAKEIVKSPKETESSSVSHTTSNKNSKKVMKNSDAGKQTPSKVNDVPPTSDIGDSKMCKNNEIVLQKNVTIEHNKDKQVTLSSKLGSSLILSKEEKEILLCKAKLEEKERKKKEKYELKKKLRHMEKVLEQCHSSDTIKKTYSKEKPASSKLKKTPENIKTKERVEKMSSNKKNSKSFKSNKKNKVNTRKSVTLKKPSKCVSISEDPYSDISIITNNTFTIECPCNSKDCTNSALHRNITKPSDNDVPSKCVSISDDPFSDISIITNNTFTIECPCNSKDCTKSALHRNTTKPSDNDVKSSVQTAENAINKARAISLKFNKNLTETEYLKLLSELDHLITHFNIGGECPFISPIIRFCRLYVDSYKVKEQAIALWPKIMESMLK